MNFWWFGGDWQGNAFNWFWMQNWGQNSIDNHAFWEAILATSLCYVWLWLIWFLLPKRYHFLYESFWFFLFTIPLIGYFYKMQSHDTSKLLKAKLYFWSYIWTLFFIWVAIKWWTSTIVTNFKILSFIPVSFFPIRAGLIFFWLLLLDIKAKFWYLLWFWKVEEEVQEETEQEEVQELPMQKLRDTINKIFTVKRWMYAVDNIQWTLEIIPEADAVRTGTFYTLCKLKPPVSALKSEADLYKLWPVVTQILKRTSSLTKIGEWSSDEQGWWLQIDDPEDVVKSKIRDKKTPYYPSYHKQYPSNKNWSINFWLNIFWKPVSYDLDDLVHLLIWWTTWSWKSVALNNIVLQLMEKNSPEDLKFVFVDPKIVTFWFYKDSPYLATPFVSLDANDSTKMHKQVVFIIDWLKSEYSKRQTMIENCWVQKMAEYNEFVQEEKHLDVIKSKIYSFLKQMVRNKADVEEEVKEWLKLILDVDSIDDLEDIKYIMDSVEKEDSVLNYLKHDCVEKWFIDFEKVMKLNTTVLSMREYKPVSRIIFAIDELADLVMQKEYGGIIMNNLANLAWVCRSAWINLIISTQHPNAEICPSLLKNNLPSAIALKVKMSTMWDMRSKTIIWQEGAAKLLGYWDCLFVPNGRNESIRLQTPYCPNEYITNFNREAEDEWGCADFPSDFFEKSKDWFSNDKAKGKEDKPQDVADKLVIESPLIDIEKELSILPNSEKYLNRADPFNVSLLPSAVRVLSYLKRHDSIQRSWWQVKSDYPKAEVRGIKQYIKYLIEAQILVPKIWAKGDISKNDLVLKEWINGIPVIVMRVDEFVRAYDENDRKI